MCRNQSHLVLKALQEHSAIPCQRSPKDTSKYHYHKQACNPIGVSVNEDSVYEDL